MHDVFESTETDAVILVDATNAFNCLNREAALRNINYLCPPLSKVLTNTYRKDPLFIDGETILSQEGTTQGDPLTMPMYAIAVKPLINQMEEDNVKQVWFADDATAGGNLTHLKAWWDRLSEKGPDSGYHPNPSKTSLIVKEGKLLEAKQVFEKSGVSITVEGKKHLGAAIGTNTFIESYVTNKVSGWVSEIERLSQIAESQPRAAYADLTHGLSSKWTYLSRTVSDIDLLLEPLEAAIRQNFLPALTGQNACNDLERELLALPVRLGGLGIAIPSSRAKCHNSASRKITGPHKDLILQQSNEFPAETKNTQTRIKNQLRTERRHHHKTSATSLTDSLSETSKRAMAISTEKGASSWLCTLPIDDHGLALHKGAFRDALCLRYGWHPQHLPSHCRCLWCKVHGGTLTELSQKRLPYNQAQ